MALDCHFTIADSWFFREARSHDAVGAGQIDSMFPPPASTLTGALRTALGDWMQVDWQAFGRGQAGNDIHELLGNGDNLGNLKIHGPYLSQTTPTLTQRFYPAPASLLREASKPDSSKPTQKGTVHRLSIGSPIHCDMGEIAMPDFKDSTPQGAQPMANEWISASGLSTWLSGQTPDLPELLKLDDIITYESRLGIARDNKRATVQEGLLYQTRHIRLKKADLSFSLRLDGLTETMENDLIQHQSSLRLGGEGREAGLALHRSTSTDAPALQNCKAAGLVLYLATPALITDGPLPGFTPVNNSAGRVTCWEGEIQGIALRLVSAATYRQQRLGGWDMKARAPKPLRSLTAAGSVFYCELSNSDQSVAEAIVQLSGCQLGELQAHGFGEVFAGYWPNAEHPQC